MAQDPAVLEQPAVSWNQLTGEKLLVNVKAAQLSALECDRS
jgi:hypothetical protein